jgi:hypothetical protein
MGLSDLVGKFFDGVKNNTSNRLRDEATKKFKKNNPDFEKQQKKDYAAYKARKRFDKKREQDKIKFKSLVIQSQGLVGDKLEKHIEKVKKAHLKMYPAAKKHVLKRIEKECIEESKIEKISKDEALKKMKELKEFLDLTVISQEEFDKKSERLKTIILGE